MVLHDSLDLFILQIANFSTNLVFLALFIYRFVMLRSFSKTDRFKDYFPKLRIFFSMVYVIINIALLVETIVFNIFYYTPIDMILVSLGEGIDSVILIIQLLVLRLELLKEQPYTPFHIAYFIYLCVFSISRLVLFLLNESQMFDTFNIVLSSVLILDSLLQLCYWIIKKQSLPQFLIPTNAEIDSLKHHSRLIQNVFDITEKSFKKKSEDNFPYIVPFVSVENGRIKIILQMNSFSQYQQNQQNFEIDDILGISKNVNRATKSQNTIRDASQSRQILSSGYYSFEEIKNLYIICSRFPMKKSLDFSLVNASLPEMAKELQEFLLELFKERRWYQPSILKYLKISIDKMKEYSEIVQKYSNFNKDTDLDQTLGVKLGEDKNSIFFSVSVFKHLWVYDHYQFYIKVVGKISQQPFYPIKRFSQFEDFHIGLKHKIKSLQKDLLLPFLPKKHLFHWNQDQQINQRRAELEKYLSLLFNDYTILSVPLLKELLFDFLGIEDEIKPQGVFQQNFYNDLKVSKGEITKTLIKNEFITYYQFKIFQKGIEVSPICKRFSQFQELHLELQRWMNNIQITYKAITLPERVYFKSENNRHEKLKNYLQEVVKIHDIGKVYALNTFFNIEGNEVEQISQIISISHSRYQNADRNPSNYVIHEVIELTNNLQKRLDRLSQSSESSNRRFSQIMNNLGDEQFD